MQREFKMQEEAYTKLQELGTMLLQHADETASSQIRQSMEQVQLSWAQVGITVFLFFIWHSFSQTGLQDKSVWLQPSRSEMLGGMQLLIRDNCSGILGMKYYKWIIAN